MAILVKNKSQLCIASQSKDSVEPRDSIKLRLKIKANFNFCFFYLFRLFLKDLYYSIRILH